MRLTHVDGIPGYRAGRCSVLFERGPMICVFRAAWPGASTWPHRGYVQTNADLRFRTARMSASPSFAARPVEDHVECGARVGCEHVDQKSSAVRTRSVEKRVPLGKDPKRRQLEQRLRCADRPRAWLNRDRHHPKALRRDVLGLEGIEFAAVCAPARLTAESQRDLPLCFSQR